MQTALKDASLPATRHEEVSINQQEDQLNQEHSRASLELAQMPKRCLLSERAVVFCANSESALGNKLQSILGNLPGQALIESFANSETRVELKQSVRDKHVYILAQIDAPVNENLVRVLLLAQAIKLADAKRTTLIVPSLPYARQDRKTDARSPISAKAVTDIFKAVGVDQIITVDLHATQVEGFFNGQFDNLSALNQIVPFLIKNESGQFIVVSPDAGGAKRAESFARKIEEVSGNFSPLVVMSKFRSAHGAVPSVTLSCGSELLVGKTCILVDDMVDTGGSILAAARSLKEQGASRVVVCTAHGIFSNNALKKLEGAKLDTGANVIDRIYVTDSVGSNHTSSDFFRVISIAPLLAETLSRLDRQMGSLFELKQRTDLGIETNVS